PPSDPRRGAPRPRAAARRSRDQENLARRLPPLQGPVGLGGLLERKLELRPEPELAVADPAEHVARAREQFLAGREVAEEARARAAEGALRAEELAVGDADRPARRAVG